jgi:methionine biosynthesis protein MetW
MRPDLAMISTWIKPQSKVLDLGCGDGELLWYLQKEKQVIGYGLEIDAANIEKCIERGINVIEQDLDDGLDNFKPGAFDFVIMTQALQAVRYPEKVLDDMLRLGQESIITFPNVGHWYGRLQLAFKGSMPVTEALPHTWYNTPNIHLCTFRDFEKLCSEKNIHIVDCDVIDHLYRSNILSRWLPNLFGEIAIYRLTRKNMLEKAHPSVGANNAF